MRLRSLSRSFSAVVMVALAVNFAFLLAIGGAFQASRQADDRRDTALRLVDGLRHETELLGRLVRAYTATADAHYLMVYYDILAVRAGEKPAPAGVDNALAWEHVVARRTSYQPAQGAQPESLQRRVQRLDFGADEQRAVQAVLEATEALRQTEQIAFAATQGLYDTVNRSFASERAPAPDYARALVHSREYETAKARLADTVATLERLTDTRTAQEVTRTSDRMRNFVDAAKAVDLLMVALVLAALMLIQRRLLRPIDQLADTARRYAAGDYTARSHRGQAGHERMAEIGALGSTLDRMAEAIEHDIAARDRNQREVEEARAQAEAATQAKSMFLANMSHEIRTPMNAIIGMTHLALGTELNAQQRDYLQKVHRAATMLLGILNDILDFSKIEAGKLGIESLHCRVEELIDNPLMLLRERAQDKDIELLCEYAQPELLGRAGSFWGDPLRLGQILTNLLSNAVKFTERGHVKLRVELLETVHADDGHATLRFTVEDTGVGLTPEQRARLFQEFTQADGSTTRRYGGTGLGLTIARRLTELMGGRIEVDSTPGEGSRFAITLPVRLIEPGALTPSDTAAQLAGMRVLVVDDHPATRASLLSQLRALGVGDAPGGLLEAVSTGQAALARTSQAAAVGQPFDLLLLDWVLPDIDGGEVLRRLHVELGDTTRVMVISAYGWDSLRTSALKAGASGFLPKPIVPETLRRALLPAATDAPGHPAEAPACPSHPLQGLRALLVEDNPVNRQLASELLAQAGAQVDLAAHGREALERLKQHGAGAYDVVLMDLQMPVLDGYETTRAMRDHPEWRTLPVLAMTAHAMVEERERCLALGMRGHIAKPIDPAGLVETLRAYLPAAPAATAGTPAPGTLQAPAPQAMPVAMPVERPALAATIIPASPWPGIDLADAARWCGSLAMAQRSLAHFLTHYADTVGRGSRLRAQLAAGRLGDLGREAHTLKGLGRQLGMADVAAAAEAMDALFKTDGGAPDPAAVAAMLEPLISALQPVLAALAAHAPMELPVDARAPLTAPAPLERSLPPMARAESAPGTVPGTASGSTTDDLAARWTRLRQLLESSDSLALVLWHECGDDFCAALPPPTARALGDAIQRCDFQQALECLPPTLPASAR
jgi:signal transduction histidine kinase/DNA-binding response OmpR family regulator/HPt (histidine-containing phosphotransfer) domain-containing protein